MNQKDYLGVDLKVGDVVAFLRPHYHDLKTGVVIKFTPKGVLVEWNYGSKYGTIKTNRSFFDVIKVSDTVAEKFLQTNHL